MPLEARPGTRDTSIRALPSSASSSLSVLSLTRTWRLPSAAQCRLALLGERGDQVGAGLVVRRVADRHCPRREDCRLPLSVIPYLFMVFSGVHRRRFDDVAAVKSAKAASSSGQCRSRFRRLARLVGPRARESGGTVQREAVMAYLLRRLEGQMGNRTYVPRRQQLSCAALAGGGRCVALVQTCFSLAGSHC